VSAFTLAGNTNTGSARSCSVDVDQAARTGSGWPRDQERGLIGVLNRGDTLRSRASAAVVAEVRVGEARSPHCTAVPQEKNAMHTTSRKQVLCPRGNWARIDGIPPATMREVVAVGREWRGQEQRRDEDEGCDPAV